MASIRRLYIAEKPSLAEHIAQAIGEIEGQRASKSDGAWRVGEDAVTWLFGHMYELAEPKAYGEKWGRWEISALPMIVPDGDWKLVVSDDKKPHVAKVAKLIKDSKSLVNAGDPAREGQLLVDELIVECGADPFASNVRRLWVQSMARKDMITALGAMKLNSEKKSLYDAAVCRQRADWQHGMNFSRLFTLLARNSGTDAKISVGRVQTPTLRLVVDRDRERLHFKQVDHFVPRMSFKHENGEFVATWIVPAEYEGLDSEGRLISKAVADALVAKISGQQGKIRSWKNEPKAVAPPLPFSLSALQAECGSKFGMTAKDVLDVAQSLYEKHKATTYPRTDSRYLPLAILKDESEGIIQALKGVQDVGEAAKAANPALKSGAWDDSKVSDHHGIIPTSEFRASKMADMSPEERNVFLLVARSFLAQFHPPHRYRALATEVSCAGEGFKATGRQVVEQGWKVVYGADADEEGEDAEQTLPSMAMGDPVIGGGGELNPKRTSPPPAFTDGTLITAMANVHRFVTDEKIKARLKETDGIGTEATRADTIETLIRRTFFKRKGKNGLESSELGRSVIDVLPEGLKDPGLTALWEGWLSEVEHGKMDTTTFMRQQSETITKMVASYRNTVVTVKGAKTVRPMDGHGVTCPKCSTGTLMTQEVHAGEHKGKRYLRCTNRDACDFTKWEAPKVKPIEGHGKDCAECKAAGRKGTMETRVVQKDGPTKGKSFLSCTLYPECKNLEWPSAPAIEGHGTTCPKCGKGKMLTRVVQKDGPSKGKSFLGCDVPECRHSVWPEDKVEPLAGHGKDCPECKKGKMRTKGLTSNKDGKKYRLLVCDRAPECKHEEWPPRDFKAEDAKSGGKPSGGKPTSGRPTQKK